MMFTDVSDQIDHIAKLVARNIDSASLIAKYKGVVPLGDCLIRDSTC